MKRSKFPKRLQDNKPSVWNEYIPLVSKYNPINLGQGYSDEAAPSYMTDALALVAKSDDYRMQQYTRGFGHMRLVQALAKLYTKLLERPLDPLNEILITAGAYEALYTAILGHIEEGDEVIIIEPFFDCYEPMVRMAGGTPRFIPLRPTKTSGPLTSADFKLDDKELESLFNERTKMIILNTPHNPLGKVFTYEELEKIASLCRKWDVICISDEVYEWMVYDSARHIRICTLPDMWDRTITIGSAGKTFSVTGWKIGWAYGTPDLLLNLRLIHQYCVDTCPTPTQEAIALGFEQEMERFDSEECFFKRLPRELEAKRNFMVKFLREAGMFPIIPEGTYFLLADWTNLAGKVDLKSENDKYRDYRFTKWMVKNIGIQGIPPSAFYGEDHKTLAEDYVRFCFIKKWENLEKAAVVLKNWKPL